MLDPVSLAKLKAVHPALGGRVVMVAWDFERSKPGDHLVVAEAFRKWSDQEAIWLKGRDAAGNVIDPAQVVTQAPPGHSWHEFGMAVDLVPESLLNDPQWEPASPLWALLTTLAEGRGLVCGNCWIHRDRPHVQLTGHFPVSPDDEARRLFQQGGVAAVWKASGL